MKNIPDGIIPLHMASDLSEALNNYRDKRHFDPERYVAQKCNLLTDYMSSCKLDTLVVGVSGGVDSAVVASMAAMVSKDRPLNTELIFIPSYKEGASGQEEALSRVNDLSAALEKNVKIIDITDIISGVRSEFGRCGIGNLDGWAAGQAVPYLRTALLYSATSVFSQDGKPGLVLGTNNFDEFGYIGYYGKASDGMVDIQMISDIHKSEVYRVGKFLGLPDSIMSATPTGDMFDGRNDHEVIGVSYDYIELFAAERCGHVNTNMLSSSSQKTWEAAKRNIEKIHGYNAHKYSVGSPAIHLDIPEYAINLRR